MFAPSLRLLCLLSAIPLASACSRSTVYGEKPPLIDELSAARRTGPTCARLHDGSVSCWGAGSFLATPRPELGVARSIVASDVVYAVQVDGRVACFAATETPRYQPGRWCQGGFVVGVGNAVRVDVFDSDACALLENGRVACWGPRAEATRGPTDASAYGVPEIEAAVDLAVGDSRACVLRVDGTVHCFLLGQRNAQPEQVPELSSVAEIVSGSYHLCALGTDGVVKCWGQNGNGELGLDSADFEPHDVPQPVQWLTSVTALSATGSRTCALVANETLHCWGLDRFGWTEKSQGARWSVAVPGTKHLTAGHFGDCIVDDSGVRCRGSNAEGELGDGTRETSLEFTQVLFADEG